MTFVKIEVKGQIKLLSKQPQDFEELIQCFIDWIQKVGKQNILTSIQKLIRFKDIDGDMISVIDQVEYETSLMYANMNCWNSMKYILVQEQCKKYSKSKKQEYKTKKNEKKCNFCKKIANDDLSISKLINTIENDNSFEIHQQNVNLNQSFLEYINTNIVKSEYMNKSFDPSKNNNELPLIKLQTKFSGQQSLNLEIQNQQEGHQQLLEKQIQFKAKIILSQKQKYEFEIFVTPNTYFFDFELYNNGDSDWPNNLYIRCIKGIHENEQYIVQALKPKQSKHMQLKLKSPTQIGKYFCIWRLNYQDDLNGQVKYFGPRIQHNSILDKYE